MYTHTHTHTHTHTGLLDTNTHSPPGTSEVCRTWAAEPRLRAGQSGGIKWSCSRVWRGRERPAVALGPEASSRCGTLDLPFPARYPSCTGPRGPGTSPRGPAFSWAEALCVEAGARLLGVPPENSAAPCSTGCAWAHPTTAAVPRREVRYPRSQDSRRHRPRARAGYPHLRSLSPCIWKPPLSTSLPSLLEPLGPSLPRLGLCPHWCSDFHSPEYGVAGALSLHELELTGHTLS